MADRRTTLLQCSLRIRRRRKWKKRWCSLTKHSPVSDQVILRFFKNQDAVELGKEISREQISISAQNFCGISLAYRYSKNPYVLTVICLDLVLLLSFDSHDQLLNWYHKIQNTLPSATAFQTPVIVPNQPSKINPGRALLHFYDNHFALTPEIPKELINSWSLSALQKYTFVGDSIFFSSTTSKGEKNFVLVTKDTTVAENLKNHFDLATSVQPPRERLSYINDSGFQHFLPNRGALLSSSSSNNGGGRYNHGSQNGGPFVHKRNQDEYGVQALQHVNCDIFRANSCCSEHGSQNSFGTRRQFEELRGRTNSHDSSNEPSIYDPLLQQQPAISSHQQNCIPMQDMLSHISQNSGVPAANGDNDFGFWKPSPSQQDETTFLYECTGGSDPSVPPVREQNYEVMNLFDHIRQNHDHQDSSVLSQHCQHTRCSKCRDHREASQLVEQRQVNEEEEISKEETSYMNLFTRRTDRRQIPESVPLTPLYIPDDAHIQDGKSPTLSDNSYFFLPAKQIVNLNGSELPSPAASAAAMVPVPFDHDSLVKPSGPISMLNSSACIASGDGAITSGKIETKDVKVTRSASGPPNVDGAGQLVTVCHRERQNSFPTQNGLRMQRKYSMPPVSGNLLADTRQSPSGYHDELPPELPPRIPPRDAFLPSPPATSCIRQRCYTDSAYAMKGVADTSLDSEHGYLMMKPAYKEKLNVMTLRSRTIASSPVDVAIPTSPLGVASRVYNTHYMGVWDRRKLSPSLIRSASGRVDPNSRYLKRSATVATNLTRQGRDGVLTIPARRGSVPSPAGGGSHSFPHRSHSVASHAPRPRTSRDYASIDPESIAQKQGSLSCRSSQDNILSSDRSFTYSDTSGSGADATPSSSSLSDLSSQATSSRASSFGSQSGVGLLYQRESLTNKDCKELDPVDDINQNR